MSDLTEFVSARLAEDEAEAANHAVWRMNPTYGVPAYQAIRERVLAECESKQRIMAEHRPTVELVEWFDSPTGQAEVCPSCHPAEPTEWNPPIGQAGVRPDGFVASYVLSPCPTLRILALPYASRADYRPEWRP